MSAITLTQDQGEDLLSFISRLKIALDSVGYENWTDERKKAIDLFQRITDKKLKDECMKKAQNDVEKFTIQFILDTDQRLKAGSRDAWEHSDKYGYVDKGVVKQNKNNNKPAPRVAKATDAAPNRRERNKCKDCGKFHCPNGCGKERRKRFDPPGNYCVSKGIPEPKRSSHQEHECRFKSGQYTWREPKPAQT